MVIVSSAKPNQPVDAAVIYDDADRFGTTWSAMMQTLNQAWHQDYPRPAPSPQSGVAAAPPRPVPPLRRTAFPDGSGTIGLPAGWQITSASHGAVWAAGPNDESVALTAIWQMYDPGSQYIAMYGRRPLPAGSAISPCCDLVRAWLAAAQRTQPQGGSNPSFHLIGSSRMAPGRNAVDALLATGEIDYHDGEGPILTKLQLSRMSGKPGSATWGMMVFRLSVPARSADQDGPTLAAIGRSLNQNGRAIRMEGDAETHAINVTAENGRIRQAEKNAANYQSNRTIEATQNEQAKRNQAFDNYLLDQTVIQNNATGAHGTTGYATANALVTQFPNQFQYVPIQNFVKPTDY